MRLIDADALKKHITEIFETEEKIDKKWAMGLKYSLKIIDNAPTVETKTIKECILAYGDGYESAKRLYERPHGEWNEIQSGMLVCPFCGAMPHKLYKNYCPQCGARMEVRINGSNNNT